jgi:hypothetical protein
MTQHRSEILYIFQKVGRDETFHCLRFVQLTFFRNVGLFKRLPPPKAGERQHSRGGASVLECNARVFNRRSQYAAELAAQVLEQVELWISAHYQSLLPLGSVASGRQNGDTTSVL